MLPGGGTLWGRLQGPAGLEAVPSHVLLGADVVLHLQAGLEDGVLLCRPTEQGEPLVQGTGRGGIWLGQYLSTCASKKSSWEKNEQLVCLCFLPARPCMFTWKLLTSACCVKMRPGLLGRTRSSSSGNHTHIHTHTLDVAWLIPGTHCPEVHDILALLTKWNVFTHVQLEDERVHLLGDGGRSVASSLANIAMSCDNSELEAKAITGFTRLYCCCVSSRADKTWTSFSVTSWE